MYNSSDEEDGCEPTTGQNAFDVLMGPPAKKAKMADEVDPIVIAVIYIRWLKWIDPSEPLYMCAYGGQAVRAGTSAEEVAAARWKEENGDAMRENKHVGLLHELKVHGSDAFQNEIVDWKRGPRSEVQKWADEREIALIAEHGGPLCDPSVRCKQTLNLDHGGKFGMNFESMDALRTVAWLRFQDEMEAYVECYESSLVWQDYVNPVSGYKLGQRLHGVRQGELWKGHPEEANRFEWLKSLPDWTLNQSKDIRDNAWDAFQSEMDEYVKSNKSSLVRQDYVNPVSGYKLGRRLTDVRRGKLWKGHPEEADRFEWLKALPDWKLNVSNDIRDNAWDAFQSEMDEYVKSNKSSLVRQDYVNPVSGYKLGQRLAGVRGGELWKGHPNESSRFEWLKSLPDWTFNAFDDIRDNAWSAFQSEMDKYVKTNNSSLVPKVYVNPVSGYKLGQRLDNVRHGSLWKGHPNEVIRVEWLEALPKWTWKPLTSLCAKTANSERVKAKRAKVLAALPESKRPQKQAEYDRTDWISSIRREKADALIKLPKYANKCRTWCYRNLSQAQKAGVVFSQDSKGVWCARMGKQGGQRAGSSAEHARTVVRAATEEAKEAASAEGESADLEEEEGVVAPRVVGLEAAGGKAVDPEESVQKAAVGGLVAAVAVMEETT